jgi:hypothetical protein
MTMAEAIKRGKGSEFSDEENIDLSAGFLPKNLPNESSTKPTSTELTPDSFMAQQLKPATVSPELTFDEFMAQQAPAAIKSSDASPIVAGPISWRWGTQADMPALQRLNFEAEIASGEPIYLPERASTWRVIAVAEKDGKVLGGIMTEDSIVVSLIGLDPSVLESAGEWLAQIVVAQAQKESTRFLQSSVSARLSASLDGAFQKLGFKPVGTSYRLDTGVQAQEQPTRRN